MIKRYSETEMLEFWRTAAGLEPFRVNGTIVVSGGIDYDRILTERMRPWYLGLLDEADTAYVAVREIGAELQTARATDAGEAVIDLPDECRRITAVRMGGWDRSVAPTDSATFEQCRLRGLNPFSAASDTASATVDNSGRLHVTLPPGREAVIELIEGVSDPGDGVYELDERALSLIPREFPTSY